ncbi:MAG TPA: vitamin K epoxide reductase family protein [Candidatus Saccharimonadales bacterium]|nr:vitamin K epoxide reductase family protein [Candidatus Saccharimonadales bacterium]
MDSSKRWNLDRAIPWLLVIGGSLGLISSIVLTYDQVQIWRNPNYHPVCSLNPVVSCGTVINSQQGHVLGIPAPFLGLIAFTVLITIGVAIWAGGRFRRWFWLGLEGGSLAGVIGAMLLFLLSIYRVHALCPFCLVTDIAVYTVAWYISLYTIDQGFIHLPKQAIPGARFARRHHLDLLIGLFLLLVIFTLHHFWYYYGQYL